MKIILNAYLVVIIAFGFSLSMQGAEHKAQPREFLISVKVKDEDKPGKDKKGDDNQVGFFDSSKAFIGQQLMPTIQSLYTYALPAFGIGAGLAGLYKYQTDYPQEGDALRISNWLRLLYDYRHYVPLATAIGGLPAYKAGVLASLVGAPLAYFNTPAGLSLFLGGLVAAASGALLHAITPLLAAGVVVVDNFPKDFKELQDFKTLLYALLRVMGPSLFMRYVWPQFKKDLELLQSKIKIPLKSVINFIDSLENSVLLPAVMLVADKGMKQE